MAAISLDAAQGERLVEAFEQAGVCVVRPRLAGEGVRFRRPAAPAAGVSVAL
ncbi:MAG: hypothetical protein ACHP7N_00355 [Caulobacterales bacterium]